MKFQYSETSEFILWWAWVYVGGWLLFIEPLFKIVSAYEKGTLSATIMLFAAIKMMVSGTAWNMLQKDIKNQIDGD